ncbi:MAG TPA: tRNA lysidine(34) synthetase TilS [Burkholderiales bacterium]|nr:tRNA lysidine(34) synthetase TilS [Burkholderiales bacterium]
MHPLIENILNNFPEKLSFNDCYTIALSGGVDSVVLLHIFSEIKKVAPIKLNAIHINHNISSNSTNWEEFCKTLCSSLSIPLIVDHHSIIKNGGESLENTARIARYSSFAKLNSRVIILAHQQNDQIETILSQIFRGSNLHNVGAMHHITHKHDKIFWRPLLNIPRKMVEEYAKKHNLQFITDESNFNTKYLRNFVRHDILPLLEKWDQHIYTKLLNINSQLQDMLTLTDEISKQDLEFTTNSSPVINLEKFKTLSHSRQLNLINYFIKINNIPLPSEKMIKEFIRQVIESSWDKSPKLLLSNNYELIKIKNFIHIGKF